jgi:hypothetical protein
MVHIPPEKKTHPSQNGHVEIDLSKMTKWFFFTHVQIGYIFTKFAYKKTPSFLVVHGLGSPYFSICCLVQTLWVYWILIWFVQAHGVLWAKNVLKYNYGLFACTKCDTCVISNGLNRSVFAILDFFV